MKKIENIIDNCKDCKSCQKFNPSKGGFGSAFICERTQRLITLAQSPYQFEFPDWCPLETYGEHSEHPTTVVLDCLPHLEWMTENLNGHGGTEVDAGYLVFSSGGVYPVDSSYRAYGFSVRCVRDISER